MIVSLGLLSLLEGSVTRSETHCVLRRKIAHVRAFAPTKNPTANMVKTQVGFQNNIGLRRLVMCQEKKNGEKMLSLRICTPVCRSTPLNPRLDSDVNLKPWDGIVPKQVGLFAQIVGCGDTPRWGCVAKPHSRRSATEVLSECPPQGAPGMALKDYSDHES